MQKNYNSKKFLQLAGAIVTFPLVMVLAISPFAWPYLIGYMVFLWIYFAPSRCL